jgi:PAS domain S-box-containing protein
MCGVHAVVVRLGGQITGVIPHRSKWSPLVFAARMLTAPWRFVRLAQRRCARPIWLASILVAGTVACGADHVLKEVTFRPSAQRLGDLLWVVPVWIWIAAVVMLTMVPGGAIGIGARAHGALRLLDRMRIWNLTEAHLREIIEATPVGMLMADERGTIVLVSREVERMFNRSREELIGQSIEVLVPEQSKHAHVNAREAFMRNPCRRRMGTGRELYGLRSDGQEFPVDVGLNPIRTDGGVVVLASIVDMTHLRSVESKLIRVNSQLEQQNAELEQFVYAVSHDLKSPLVTILGYASEIRQALAGSRVSEAPRYAERICQAAARMRRYIDDLLEVSRIGRVAVTPQWVDLVGLVREVWRTLVLASGHADAELVMSFERRECFMDATQLSQVLQNLVDNALKYGCEGPDRRVEVGSVEDGAECVRLFVRDHGPGIEPDDRDRIFGLFERGAKARPGTGVGLTIVRRVAEMNGGRVWIEDTPGGGATFWVALPQPGHSRAKRGDATAKRSSVMGAMEGDRGVDQSQV